MLLHNSKKVESRLKADLKVEVDLVSVSESVRLFQKAWETSLNLH